MNLCSLQEQPGLLITDSSPSSCFMLCHHHDNLSTPSNDTLHSPASWPSVLKSGFCDSWLPLCPQVSVNICLYIKQSHFL